MFATILQLPNHQCYLNSEELWFYVVVFTLMLIVLTSHHVTKSCLCLSKFLSSWSFWTLFVVYNAKIQIQLPSISFDIYSGLSLAFTTVKSYSFHLWTSPAFLIQAFLQCHLWNSHGHNRPNSSGCPELTAHTRLHPNFYFCTNILSEKEKTVTWFNETYSAKKKIMLDMMCGEWYKLFDRISCLVFAVSD